MSILFIISDVKDGVDYCFDKFGEPEAYLIMEDRAFLKYPDGSTIEIINSELVFDIESKDKEYDILIIEESIRLNRLQVMAVKRVIKYDNRLFDDIVKIVEKEK